MKTQQLFMAVILTASVVIYSCSKEDDNNNEGPVTFESVIKSGGEFEPVEEKNEVIDSTQSEQIIDGEEIGRAHV